MNRDLLVRAIESKPCTAIGKNLKSIILGKQSQAHKPCMVTNQVIQIDFAGAIYYEKDHDTYILTCIDRFSKYPSSEILDNAKASNLTNFLDNYIQIHEARCLIGNQVKNFCTKINIILIPAPAYDHQPIGLVERLISTIEQRLACIKEADKDLNSFTIKVALKSILYQLRICKNKTIKISPFESHIGKKPILRFAILVLNHILLIEVMRIF